MTSKKIVLDLDPQGPITFTRGVKIPTGDGKPLEIEFEFLFRDRVLQILAGHDFDAAPLFLLYTPHVAHCPLQVPRDVLATYAALTEGTDETLCQEQTASIFPGSTAADYGLNWSQMFDPLANAYGAAKILADALQTKQQQAADDRTQQLSPSEITALVRVLAAPPPPEAVEDTEGQGDAVGFSVGEPSAFDDFGGPLAG